MKESEMRAKRLTVAERKEIFHTLVVAQDNGDLSVSESRQQVTKQYEITEAQLRQIEDEGLEKEWPPLDEAVQKAG
jgi:transcription elongation GreA/GreB family factor